MDNPNNHGSGCTLSSAIASFLAMGCDLGRAVERAKAYITACMEAGLDLGSGSGPLRHNYAVPEGGAVGPGRLTAEEKGMSAMAKSDVSTRKLAVAGILTAVAVAGSLFSFPVLASRCSPVQHMVNILCAVFLGPWYGVAAAFAASLIRNLLGAGHPAGLPRQHGGGPGLRPALRQDPEPGGRLRGGGPGHRGAGRPGGLAGGGAAAGADGGGVRLYGALPGVPPWAGHHCRGGALRPEAVPAACG